MKIILEYIGFRSKSYGMLYRDEEETEMFGNMFGTEKQKGKCKGIISKFLPGITLEKYKEYLTNGKDLKTEQIRILSKKHGLFTIIEEKIVMNAMNDKNWIDDDRITCRPLGHNLNK